MQNDKKVKSNRLRLILLTTIGNAIITDQVSTDEIIAAWKKLLWHHGDFKCLSRFM